MSEFIYSLKQSRQEQILLLLFISALMLFSYSLGMVLVRPNSTSTLFPEWSAAMASLWLLAGSLSMMLGYLFYWFYRISQRARHYYAVKGQLRDLHHHLNQTLRHFLLTEPQRQRLTSEQDEAEAFTLMKHNMDSVPYRDNQLLPAVYPFESTLTLRLMMVQQYEMHIAMIRGLLLQAQQLAQVNWGLHQRHQGQVANLIALLTINETALVATQQERWNTLHKVYQPLCQYLERYHQPH
ncbi:MAG: hypothetical protein R3Y10_06745 [Ferrimonas sp.]